MDDNSVKKLLVLVEVLYIIFLNNKIQIFAFKRKLISKEPKLSVIIPMYNGACYLNHSLRSVQNQKFKDIEIIIVDDNSSDDSVKIIRSFIKKDKRIKLIENKENRRILFSKSLGTLNSKGKYIIEIDQDDMFIRDDAFDILYKESEKYGLDILHFNHTKNNKIFNHLILNNNMEIENIDIQPKLKINQFKTNIYLLWGNLIKTDLYKKVIYNLWPIIINYKIIFQEDFLITFFILIYAQKSKNINNIFYYHYINSRQASYGHHNNPDFFLSVIFAGIIFYDYYINCNPQDFQIIINYINKFKNALKIAQKLYPSFFKHFFGKILTNKHLIKKNKSSIMKIFNISENCDSYPFLSSNKSFFFFNESSKNKTYSHNQKNGLIELSIIIICSNYEKNIKIINSINSQNFDYLEIIIIYDDENKNDYLLLNNYIKSFYHIQLIENKFKKGILQSISKGVNIARGNYLLILDSNCFFSNTNAFQNIFKEITKYDADILEFNLYTILPNNYIYLYKCKHFESRFNLSKIKYNQDFNNIDIHKELLTNKIIKSKYFKNIIKNFKLDEIDEILDYYYNNIFDFIIETNKHNFKRISSVSIYINDIDFNKPTFNNFTSENNKRINELIFYINFIFDNSKNNYADKEKILKEFFNVLSIFFNKYTKISKESILLMNKFIQSNYFSKQNKTLLKFYYNSLIN